MSNNYECNAGLTTNVRRYDFFDALRGYAILGVLFVHAGQAVAAITPSLTYVIPYGARGVQLFYLASAWTLCLSFYARKKEEFSPLRNYFIRRFFRIAPLFYVAIVVWTIIMGEAARYWAPNGVPWWYVVATALFLNGFHPEMITSVVPGGWSVVIEMNFYLLLPLLIVRINTLKRAALLVVGTTLLSIAILFLVQQVLSPLYPPAQQYLVASFAERNILAQLPVFSIGILAFFLFLRIDEFTPAYLQSLVRSYWMMLIGGLVLQFVFWVVLPSHVFFTTLFFVFALYLAKTNNRLLVNKVIVFVGKISFSMYLTHFVVIGVFRKSGLCSFFDKGDTVFFAYFFCLVLTTVIVSYVSYRLIEQPGIKLGKRIIDSLEHTDKRSAIV